ncbi:hypothetical protein JXB01_03405 [Candidatus Micrarchaeota archaeon]|nr:hypothetical protein [Candidatus Micrarchaeota archaeon]
MIDLSRLKDSLTESCPCCFLPISIPYSAFVKRFYVLFLFKRNSMIYIASYPDHMSLAEKIYSMSFEDFRSKYDYSALKNKIESLVGSWKDGMNRKELKLFIRNSCRYLEELWEFLMDSEAIKHTDIEVFVDPFIKKHNFSQDEIEIFREALLPDSLTEEEKRKLELIEIAKSGAGIGKFIKFHPKYAGYDSYEFYSEKEISSIIKNLRKKDLEEEMRKVDGRRASSIEAFDRLIEITNLSREEEEKIRITRLLSGILDERRAIANLLHAYLLMAVDKFSEMEKLDPMLLKNLSFEFFLKDFDAEKIKKASSEERISLFLGNKEILKGKPAEEKFNEVRAHLTETNKDMLKGFGASPGKAKGKAKIVLNTHDDFPQGSILVTYFTNPEYVPLMRKASAVITEFGGITSHAAIVSREFKIPCIVAVKNAVKSIKDGELIEVDGDTGEIKILD